MTDTQLLTHPDGPPTAAMAPVHVSPATTWFARWLPRWLMRTFTPTQAALAATTWVLVGIVAFAAAPPLGGHVTPDYTPTPTTTAPVTSPATRSPAAVAGPATNTAPQRIATPIPQTTAPKPAPTRTVAVTVTVPAPTTTTTDTTTSEPPDRCAQPDPPRKCEATPNE